MWKIILTLGFGGDYNTLRRYTEKYKIFYPLYLLYERLHAAATSAEELQNFYLNLLNRQ